MSTAVYTGRTALSVHAINTLAACPEKYRLHYHEGLPTGSAIPFERGKIVHEALHAGATGHAYNSTIAAQQARRYAHHHASDFDALGWAKDDVQQFVGYVAETLLPAYYASSACERNLTATELKIVDEEMQPPFLGYVDYVRKDHTLGDYKYHDRAPTGSMEWDPQLATYAAIYERSKGVRPPQIVYLHIIGTKVPRFVPEVYDVTPGMIEEARRDLDSWYRLLTHLEDHAEWPRNRKNCCTYGRPCEFVSTCFTRPAF